jgi:hypothetical protein
MTRSEFLHSFEDLWRREITMVRKPEGGQPLPACTYAIISLIGLVLGLGLLVFYVYEVPRLVETSSQSQVYYLLLIPWALACAAFLFGAMRSYGRFTHKHLGNALELGGPVVLFCLVVAGGFKLVPPAPATFDLTVRAHSADDKDPLINHGGITVELGSVRRTESIDSAGEANFKGIPPRFKGASVRILPLVEGYAEQWQTHKLSGDVLDLPLARAALPTTLLTGTIIPPPEEGVEIRILVEGQQGDTSPDKFGRFQLPVKGKDGDRVRLEFWQGAKLLKYDDYVLPGPAQVKLDAPH